MEKKRKTALKIAVTGGGTGGHLFPGIAIADAFQARFSECEIMFVGTDRYIDSQALNKKKFVTVPLKCGALKGKGILSVLGTLVQLPLSLFRAMRILQKFRPDLVVGVGGYVTGPVVLAARVLGIPTCIHEQNSIPGMANRILGKFVNRVFISIPGSCRYFSQKNTILTGNPIRRELLDSEKKANQEGISLLVLGGSQGAHKINSLVCGALANLGEKLPAGFQVIHQTGFHDAEIIRKEYERAGIQSRVAAFFDDMASVYREADFVVSRAGATTLAEIAALMIPAILIPYPFAADNHQEKNALYLAEAGAALMFHEKDMTKERLAKEIAQFIDDRGKRLEMGRKMGEMALPAATEKIVGECLALMKERGRSMPSEKRGDILHVL